MGDKAVTSRHRLAIELDIISSIKLYTINS